MKTNLLYGQNGLEIEVSDDAFIVEPNHLPGLENDIEALKEALKNPIGTAPLKEMVKATDKVAIVISDITRPTPNHKMVPVLIEELNHVPIENFVIINGT
ncbi:MAG: lactate racemase domain-containing protein, partial [Bacillus sp. (in: firmicutes)]